MDVFEEAPDVITNTVGSQNWCHALDLPTWEIGWATCKDNGKGRKTQDPTYWNNTSQQSENKQWKQQKMLKAKVLMWKQQFRSKDYHS